MTPTLMGDNFTEIFFLILMYFLKNLLYSWEYIKQTEFLYIVIMTKEGSIKIVNFIKLLYFLANLQGIDQTKWGYSNDDQGRVYQNCKFNHPRGSLWKGKGGGAKGWVFKLCIILMTCISIYSIMIAIVLRFLLLLLIFIYFMMALLICKYESKSQCRISATQVYIKAHGPLVSH